MKGAFWVAALVALLVCISGRAVSVDVNTKYSTTQGDIICGYTCCTNALLTSSSSSMYLYLRNLCDVEL